MLTADDRLDLLHLQYFYGHVLDAFLWNRLDEIFADDGVFDPSDVGLPIMRGLDEIREKLIPLEEGPSRDHVHNHIGTNPTIIAEMPDGTVQMRCKYIASGAGDYISFGEYFDECVKTERGWRIKHRKTRRITANHAPFLSNPPRFDPKTED